MRLIKIIINSDNSIIIEAQKSVIELDSINDINNLSNIFSLASIKKIERAVIKALKHDINEILVNY